MSLAMVFPGQGSQFVGMLNDMIPSYPEITEIFTRASKVLGYDLWQLVQTGPPELLNQTEHTQPAILSASYALFTILSRQSNLQTEYFAGHSLGEYTALVCSDSLDFEEAIYLVAARGRFMQEAVQPGIGAMAAILGLEDEKVGLICEQATQEINELVSPANFNSPGQVVIAGYKKAVEHAMNLIKEKGGKAILLPVSVPSHCLLMQGASELLAELLNKAEIKLPKVTVINNIQAIAYTTINQIREGLKQQLVKPVCWVETIQFFIQSGVSRIIECGPGKVLTGLNKRIDKNLMLQHTADLASLRSLL